MEITSDKDKVAFIYASLNAATRDKTENKVGL